MLLFFSPEVHLTMLQRMWVDGLLHKSVWESAFNKINEEWADITLLVGPFFQVAFSAFSMLMLFSKATVILTAAVSFLNISGITDDKNTLPYISSCISIAATTGSIVVGLLLKRQHQTKIRDTTDEIVSFNPLKTGQVLSHSYRNF
jgi:hypothetical protein